MREDAGLHSTTVIYIYAVNIRWIMPCAIFFLCVRVCYTGPAILKFSQTNYSAMASVDSSSAKYP